jgi:hypothetical protein
VSAPGRAMSTEAEQVPADIRLTVLRKSLSNASTTATALVDLAAELRHAGAPGLAWDSDYLADQIDALAGAIALLLKAAEEPNEPTDQRAADQPGRAD